ASVLTVVYGTYPPAQRLRLLLPLCERWNVCVPPKTDAVNEDDYCRGVVQQLALKAGRVCDMNEDRNSVETLSTMSTVVCMNDRLDSIWCEGRIQPTCFGVDGGATHGQHSYSGDGTVYVEDLCSSTWDSDITIYAKRCA
ncbi:receptor-type adenylate cyclase, partial [Trypanosoma theileri]